MTTMQDVANRVGVSAKTVSRVFKGDEHVSEETRSRVMAAMEALNYVPNMMARTFREGRASVIGVAVPDIGDPFFAAVIRAIDQEAKAHNMAIAVTSLGDDPDRERRTVEALLGLQINGLIIAPISSNQAYLARWLTRAPAVFIDRGPSNLVADSFVEDDSGAAEEAILHLYSRGHRRIAFIGDETRIITSDLRLRGYRRAFEKIGVGVDEELIALGPTTEAERIVTELLGMQDPPSAIFSSNARTSLVVFPALQNLKRTDVALVSFGDFEMAASLQPSVTVLDQNPERLGREAAQRLFVRFEHPGRRLKRRNVLPVKLIERASSAPRSPVL